MFLNVLSIDLEDRIRPSDRRQFPYGHAFSISPQQLVMGQRETSACKSSPTAPQRWRKPNCLNDYCWIPGCVLAESWSQEMNVSSELRCLGKELVSRLNMCLWIAVFTKAVVIMNYQVYCIDLQGTSQETWLFSGVMMSCFQSCLHIDSFETFHSVKTISLIM